MRVLTSKDEDLPSNFEKLRVSEARVLTSSIEQLLTNIHNINVRKLEISGQFALEYFSGFLKTIRKNTKGIKFHITLKALK